MDETMAQLTAKQLSEIYPNGEDRERLFKIYALRSFLSGCSIENEYRVPDNLHTPLVFTKYGDRVADKLRRSNGVPFPESRLLCLLEMLGPEPLIDVTRTDIEALQAAISKQIKSQELKHPFRYGRILYDKFSSLHREARMSLSPKETMELLQGTPQGVLQVDEYVSGPYGLMVSASHRSIMPDLYVPLQSCSDLSCDRVHRVALDTGHDAPINEYRARVIRILERDGRMMNAWIDFFDSIAERYSASTEANGEPLILLVGDALTDEELRSLLAWLLDNSAGRLRESARSVGLSGSSQSIVRELDRAQLLQLICVAQNELIFQALDKLVTQGTISVPEGETRVAVINGDSHFGPYHMFAELSCLGVRLQSSRSSIASLRMRKLVEKMYNLESESERTELLWQLRAQPDESVERRLQTHLQSEELRTTITKLTLARRSNVVVASEYLKFAEANAKTDTALIDLIVWKLGFPVDRFPDINEDLFRIYEKMTLAIRQNDLEPHAEFFSDLRGLCSNYFVKLEEVLRDSVSYTAWALTTDHFTSLAPYEYRSNTDGVIALLSLNDIPGDDSDHKVTYTDPPTIYAVCRGYERLAVKLADIMTREPEYRRPIEQYPGWVKRKDGLQRFPFTHTVPFLDLAQDSQEYILERLRLASKQLVGADPSELRSGLLHPRPSNTDLERLRSGMETIRETLEKLEADGFCRLMYTIARFEGDSVRRERIWLTHKRGYSHSLHKPSGYSWLRLPNSSQPQYVMSSAKLKESSEVLRFTRRVESPFAEMYSDYPKRPLRSRREEM